MLSEATRIALRERIFVVLALVFLAAAACLGKEWFLHEKRAEMLGLPITVANVHQPGRVCEIV